MIKDKLYNAKRYYNLSEGIKKGLEYLKNNDIMLLQDGKYPIVDDKLFININSYNSKNDADWEVHSEYIDIQYLVSGEEKIGISEKSKCVVSVPYNSQNDIEFLEGQFGDFYIMHPCDFMIIYPGEVHKPGIKIKENLFVKKAILKVAKNY